MKNVTLLVSILLIASYGNQGGQKAKFAETNENIDRVRNTNLRLAENGKPLVKGYIGLQAERGLIISVKTGLI